MNELEDIASCFSILFLEDYELPNLNVVTNLIKNFCEDESKPLKGVFAFQAFITKLMMDAHEIISLVHSVGPFSSKTFTKQFGYNCVEAKDENPLLRGIKLILNRTRYDNKNDIPFLMDYLKGVVFFNEVKEARVKNAMSYVQSIFEFCLGKDGILNPFEGQSVADVYLKSCRSKKFVDMLHKYCRHGTSSSYNDEEVEATPLMKEIVMTAAKLSNATFKCRQHPKKGRDEVDTDNRIACQCQGDCPCDIVPADGDMSQFAYFGEHNANADYGW